MINSHPKSYASIVLNLKKSHGMLKKIDAMVAADEYCGDIAQQINATIGLLKKMNTELLKSHLISCGKTKLFVKDKKEVDLFLDEFFRLVDVGIKR